MIILMDFKCLFQIITIFMIEQRRAQKLDVGMNFLFLIRIHKNLRNNNRLAFDVH